MDRYDMLQEFAILEAVGDVNCVRYKELQQQLGYAVRCRRCNRVMLRGICDHCDSIPYANQTWKHYVD